MLGGTTSFPEHFKKALGTRSLHSPRLQAVAAAELALLSFPPNTDQWRGSRVPCAIVTVLVRPQSYLGTAAVWKPDPDQRTLDFNVESPREPPQCVSRSACDCLSRLLVRTHIAALVRSAPRTTGLGVQRNTQWTILTPFGSQVQKVHSPNLPKETV